MNFALVRAATLSAALIPAAALAQTAGSVTTELNVRQGPGSNYPVVATIPAGGDVTISGCLEGGNWCEIKTGGTTGYAYSRYLTAEEGGSTVTASERPSLFGIVTAPVNLVTGTAGAFVGALEPGESTARNRTSTTDSSFQSTPEVIDYVRNNPPSDKIFLEGEAVPGARIPAGVALQNVPDTQYQYAGINGESVIVDRATRTVLYIVR